MSISDDDVIAEPSDGVRDATADLMRAFAKLVAAKFDTDLATLAETDIGAELQAGTALITAAIIWPNVHIMLKLRRKGHPDLELLEVLLPRANLQ